MRESDSFRRAQRQYDLQTPYDNEPPEDFDPEKALAEYEAAMEAKYERQRNGD
jgi:hypothetical protein